MGRNGSVEGGVGIGTKDRFHIDYQLPDFGKANWLVIDDMHDLTLGYFTTAKEAEEERDRLNEEVRAAGSTSK